MLTFFRRIINSKAGIVVTFIVLGIVAIAFAAGDITGLGGGTSALSGGSVATVGGQKVAAAELRSRVQTELQAARQQQPTATMEQLLDFFMTPSQPGAEVPVSSHSSTTAASAARAPRGGSRAEARKVLVWPKRCKGGL